MSKLCLNLNHHLGLHINICIIHWRFVHDFLPLYDWTRYGLGGEVFDWYLWQSPLARSRCNGLVYSSGNAMRCGPFVAKYMRKIKIRRFLYFSNTSDAHWGSAQCTEDEIEIFPEHEDLCDPLRTVQQCQKCGRWWRWPPTKMFFFWRLVVFSDPGGKHAWIYGTWQTQKKTKYSSYLQCSLNKIGADCRYFCSRFH